MVSFLYIEKLEDGPFYNAKHSAFMFYCKQVWVV